MVTTISEKLWLSVILPVVISCLIPISTIGAPAMSTTLNITLVLLNKLPATIPMLSSGLRVSISSVSSCYNGLTSSLARAEEWVSPLQLSMMSWFTVLSLKPSLLSSSNMFPVFKLSLVVDLYLSGYGLLLYFSVCVFYCGMNSESGPVDQTNGSTSTVTGDLFIYPIHNNIFDQVTTNQP